MPVLPVLPERLGIHTPPCVTAPGRRAYLTVGNKLRLARFLDDLGVGCMEGSSPA